MFCRLLTEEAVRRKKRVTDRQTDSFVCVHPCEVPPNPHDGLLLLALLLLLLLCSSVVVLLFRCCALLLCFLTELKPKFLCRHECVM